MVAFLGLTCHIHVKKFATDLFPIFLKQFLEDTCPFCGATDTHVLDFLHSRQNVSKKICDGFISRFYLYFTAAKFTRTM